MLTFASSLVLGVVEGFTEFLPISSTAHLVLTSQLLGIAQSPFVKVFEVSIQSGAILAVVVLFWKKFWNWEILKHLFVAFLPTGILGLIFFKIIEKNLLGNIAVTLFALGLGGLFLVLFERFHHAPAEGGTLASINYKESFIIGLFQSVSMVPGVSRAGATIVGGMFLGLSRELIVEFSFLLAVPTMLAATGLDVVKNTSVFSTGNLDILAVGFIASFITAIISIQFFLSYIRKHTFTSFGIYRVVLAFLFLALLR